MNNPKISIIIPFNNIEGYLTSCLDSLVNQTMGDLEFICVDDGSTDNSLQVVLDYQKNDPRFKVIKVDEKRGQAFARNRGLEIATGEYIGFVDGDDWVEINMFEKMYENAARFDSDIVICATHVHNEYTQKSSHDDAYYNLDTFDSSFDERSFSPLETKDILLNLNVVIWNKLYKREFLNEIGAKFSEGYIYEDLPFFFETYLPAKKISLVRDFLYFYRTNRTGSTMSTLEHKVLDRIDMVSLTHEFLKKASFYEEIKQDVLAWIISDLFHRYTLVDKKYLKEFYFKMKKVFLTIDETELDPSKLKYLYYHKEFQLVKKVSFEEFNKRLLNKFKFSKKMVHDAKSDRDFKIYEIEQKYIRKINEIEVENKKYNKAEIEEQKEWFEQKLKAEMDSFSQSLDDEKQKSVEYLREWYENELQNQKNWYQNELLEQKSRIEQEVEKIRCVQKEYYEKTLKIQTENQKQWLEEDFERRLNEKTTYFENEVIKHQQWHQENLNKELENLKNAYEADHQNQLEAQKRWFSEELQQNTVYYQELLKKELESQKNWYENEIQNRLNEQKAWFEEQMRPVRFIIKVINRLKKIKNNLKKHLG